ncbi:MAG: glycosyltransferase family 9 protein [Deltaproteobacteria bacterium]|nr:glycosyltransferase family 9 protein [Deltaproteobacteria bacterium]
MAGIKAKFVFFLYGFLNLSLLILSFMFWPKKIIAPKKICIYRIGNVGDIVCAIPAIIAIRRAFPDAHITLLTSPGARVMAGAGELIKDAWFIDKLWIYYSDEIKELIKVKELIKKIRTETFDLWINLPHELINYKTLIRNMLFIKLCGVKAARCFEVSTIKLWAKEQSRLRRFDNEAERLMKILRRWRIPVKEKIIYELPLPLEVEKSSQELMRNYGLGTSRLFGFVPGAKYHINQWPIECFVKAGKFILHKYPDAKIVIFGSQDDYGKGDFIKNRIGNGSVINLCGKTSLLQAAFILRHMGLVISNNTGPMHMAALGGVKVIGIFSSAELNGKWFPYGQSSRVVMKNIDCGGCYYRCSNDKHCIKSIKPDSVNRLIETMI